MNKFTAKALKNKDLSQVSTVLKRAMKQGLARAGIVLAAAIGVYTGSAVAQPAPVKIAMIEGLSGAFGNTGEAVFRNLLWATERVNARNSATGGVKLELKRYDSKGQADEAISMLRAAVDDGAQVIMQGNSSATAAALIDAVNKHNERNPDKTVMYLNTGAVDPALTNDKCSFWHFRFDADAEMKMAALTDAIAQIGRASCRERV